MNNDYETLSVTMVEIRMQDLPSKARWDGWEKSKSALGIIWLVLRRLSCVAVYPCTPAGWMRRRLAQV